MILLRYKEDYTVYYQHRLPIGETKDSLAKTKEELIEKGYLENGILIDSLPVRPEEQEGKILVLYANPLHWEYEDLPLTQEEKLQQLVDAGTITQEQMDDLLS